MVPNNGITEKEYRSYTLRVAVGQDGRRRKRAKKNCYCARRGFVTLLNSKQAKVPPGLRTRCASRRTSGMEVTFRIPNAMV
jgi:hypothetical protein